MWVVLAMRAVVVVTVFMVLLDDDVELSIADFVDDFELAFAKFVELVDATPDFGFDVELDAPFRVDVVADVVRDLDAAADLDSLMSLAAATR